LHAYIKANIKTNCIKIVEIKYNQTKKVDNFNEQKQSAATIVALYE